MYRNSVNLVHLHTSKKRYNISFASSLDTLNKNTDSRASAQSVEQATAARTIPGSRLSHSLLFGQNLGTCVSCDRIGKKLKNKLTLACVSVKRWKRPKVAANKKLAPASMRKRLLRYQSTTLDS